MEKPSLKSAFAFLAVPAALILVAVCFASGCSRTPAVSPSTQSATTSKAASAATSRAAITSTATTNAAATEAATTGTSSTGAAASESAPTTEVASSSSAATVEAPAATTAATSPKTPKKVAPRLEDPLDYSNGEEYADNAYKYFEYMGSDDPWNDALEYWDQNGP